MSATDLQAFEQALAALRAQPGSVQTFSASVRAQTALLAALPPQFTTVLHQLLDRLESSALFAEESCSFSQQDLLASLDLWLEKARPRLQT